MIPNVKSRAIIIISFFIIFFAFSCNSPSEESPQPTSSTLPIVTNPNGQEYTCSDVDAYWGNNWPIVIAALDDLIVQEQTCGDEPLMSKKYAAHFNFAVSLEMSGEVDAAIENYQAAFLIDSNRSDALNALIRLNALPEPTAVSCELESAPLPDPSPVESLNKSSFVQVEGDKFLDQGRPYSIKGVNYYPRHAPWHRFLLEADFSEIEVELDLIKQAGFNTVRIFLWYEPLFTCRPKDAIPNQQVFQKVDRLINLAKSRELKLIVTLNDLPDLIFRPLYTDWERYDTQTIYIVRRYQNEPTILAWDLRNEGDLDYGARLGEEARFDEDVVLNWLAHVSNLVRENDPNHLITAGWWGDPTVTEPHVDFLSFHHWNDTLSLRNRITTYARRSTKPILLEEIGYHSWQDAPHDQRSEAEQADSLSNAIEVAESEGIAGWMIWSAFDFVPEPGQTPNFEHFFGLWRSDLTPKPAVSQIFSD